MSDQPCRILVSAIKIPNSDEKQFIKLKKMAESTGLTFPLVDGKQKEPGTMVSMVKIISLPQTLVPGLHRRPDPT